MKSSPIVTVYYRPGVAKPLATIKADVDHHGAREISIDGNSYILNGLPMVSIEDGVLTRSWACAVPIRKKRGR